MSYKQSQRLTAILGIDQSRETKHNLNISVERRTQRKNQQIPRMFKWFDVIEGERIQTHDFNVSQNKISRSSSFNSIEQPEHDLKPVIKPQLKRNAKRKPIIKKSLKVNVPFKVIDDKYCSIEQSESISPNWKHDLLAQSKSMDQTQVTDMQVIISKHQVNEDQLDCIFNKCRQESQKSERNDSKFRPINVKTFTNKYLDRSTESQDKQQQKLPLTNSQLLNAFNQRIQVKHQQKIVLTNPKIAPMGNYPNINKQILMLQNNYDITNIEALRNKIILQNRLKGRNSLEDNYFLKKAETDCKTQRRKSYLVMDKYNMTKRKRI